MRNAAMRRVIFNGVASAVILLSGCACPPGNSDPLEKINRVIYRFNEGLDRALLEPASDLYVKHLPEPARTGLANAFENLGYANVVLNDFLQGQWGQGLQDAARMAVNSTIGVAGIFDVATRWDLPAHRNDFGLTLGKWGAGPGPYLVVPLLGPSSGRDILGFGTVLLTSPIYWINPPLTVTIPLTATRLVVARSDADSAMQFRDEAAIDPYVFTRDTYLQHRRNLILSAPPPPDDGFYEPE